MSLREYVLCAKSLEEEGDPNALMNLTLTGEIVDGFGDKHQVLVDPIRNVMPTDHPTVVSRDYDSVIGITSHIVVGSSISLYPIPDPSGVLSTSLHLKYSFQGKQVSLLYFHATCPPTVTQIPYHRIPNFRIGYWSQRHMIQIFFPSLYTEERKGAQMSRDEKREFYESGLRPTIENLAPHDASDWPATYDDEAFRAKKKSGAFAYQTKQFPQWLIPRFADTLREELKDNNVNWAEDFFFIHMIRGTKHGSQHSKDEQSASLALTEYLSDCKIPEEALDDGDWWIDVGLEISSTEHACLQWRTSSHFHMTKEVLHINDTHASRITSLTSSKYQRDLVSHLTAVAGCRIEPGPQAEGIFEAAYFQMYTTDKAITYNPEGIHHGKAISIEKAMGPEQPPEFVEGLLQVYGNAIEKNASNARVEVRVPMVHATTALVDVCPNVIEQSLLSFTSEEWWYV
jgi:hypothetical protein